jgi:RNA polymerase sigma factor (sigma-70 family)
MASDQPVFADLKEGRRRFLALVEDLRPDLHRYCARMVGSIADGEDIVQDTLARAYYELAGLNELPALRAWLFRIAHNRALDHLRRYDRRMGEPLGEGEAEPVDGAGDAEGAIVRDETVRAAIARFLELPPAPRSCVILKDVLGCSLDEMTAMLDLSLPAIKAALHRGRARLGELAGSDAVEAPPPATSPELGRYVALFNARDWEGVRALLVEDVRLDLVSRSRRVGREVFDYLGNYDKVFDWTLVPAWLDGREVVGVLRDPGDERASYFIALTFTDGRVAAIRDYRYVPYIGREAAIALVG